MTQNADAKAKLDENIRMIKTQFKYADAVFFGKDNQDVDTTPNTQRVHRNDSASEATPRPGMPRIIPTTTEQRQRARESQRNAIRQARSGEASPVAGEEEIWTMCLRGWCVLASQGKFLVKFT